MKKILGIIVLGLLLSGNANADCKDDIDMSWEKPNPYMAFVQFEFLNNNNKDINITSVRMLTADKQIIINHVPVPAAQTLKSFGRLIVGISLNNVNENVWKLSDYSCSYK